MKFLIVGAGRTGHAAVAHLTALGGECRVLTRCPKKAETINKHGITSTGAVEGVFKTEAFTDVSEAVKGIDVILIMTISNGHRPVCETLRPVLEHGQSIVISNGNWGAFEFKQILGDDIAVKDLTVAETGSGLYLAKPLTAPSNIHFEIKNHVPFAATDPQKTALLANKLADYYPQFKPVGSIYESSLSAINPTIHAPITLLNYVRTENGQPWYMYAEGVAPTAVNLIAAVDAERLALARALGFEVSDVVSSVNSFWKVQHDNLFDVLNKNEDYRKILGPDSIEHRFITEDVPFGIVPLSKLGRILNVPTPYSDLVVNAFSVMLKKDLMEEGVIFTKEDFS